MNIEPRPSENCDNCKLENPCSCHCHTKGNYFNGLHGRFTITEDEYLPENLRREYTKFAYAKLESSS